MEHHRIVNRLDEPESDIHAIMAEELNISRQDAKMINISIFGRILAVQDRDDVLNIYDTALNVSLNKFPLEIGMVVYYKEDDKPETSVAIHNQSMLDEMLTLQKTVRLYKTSQY